MQQALYKLGFSGVPVVYKFKARSDFDYSEAFKTIQINIDCLSQLFLTDRELGYMQSLRYFHDDYLYFLKDFRFNTDFVHLELMENGDLDLTISGPWFQTILFEVPILAIISESVASYSSETSHIAHDRLLNKLKHLPIGFRFGDFGTRRRRSCNFHNKVVSCCDLHARRNFIGTSNLFFAMKYNIKAIGTMAHEWLQAHQQLGYRLVDSQKMAFENWIKVYRGDLGIALSDVINTEVFLKDFSDPLLYKLFDGVREDSDPNPIGFAGKIVKFYLDKRIDPKTKTIVFSNGLSFPEALNIYYSVRDVIGSSFGIGTNLTNDWETPAQNIVIKMIKCNGQPVAKISNSPGKGMCEDDEFVSYLKSVFKLEHN
jgi:nicotinate phosphoribosyltransferase